MMNTKPHAFKSFIYGLAGKPFIPSRLLQQNQRLVIHVSDTPEEIHSFLVALASKLRPVAIIHTGDVADNHKLEFQPGLLPHYRKAAERLISALTVMCPGALYITPGNHDHQETLSELLPGGVVEQGWLKIQGRWFYLTHNLEEIPHKPGYYCFGHKFDPPHHEADGVVLLNGLLSINVINLETGEVDLLHYPLGTNGYRKMTESRVGL